jgi:hypothetical protein
MEWLSQNWIWLALAVGAVLFFSRGRHGGMMGGCCGGMAHEGPGEERKTQGSDTPPPAAKKAGDPQAQGTASAHRHAGGCH